MKSMLTEETLSSCRVSILIHSSFSELYLYVYIFCGKAKKDKVCYPPAHLPPDRIGSYIFYYMKHVVVPGDEDGTVDKGALNLTPT